MPTNKRESLIYTIMMCFLMVLWMSMYNVALLQGGFSIEVVRQSWLGLPLVYVVAMCLDWFIVSKYAKGVAFRYLIKPASSPTMKRVMVSSCMVLPMVFFMSLYGGLEACFHSGEWTRLPIIWALNVPKNLIMALPFQLLIAGPIVQKLFRKGFPEGKVLA
ncbi:DUF2798 domain-containing protein [Enterococcus florum]|uniref:DUF2798 domain-containing protein n=1 Tax=Enterococcus florum TaxID=2480627 RepID=A0A4P5PA26_9ENTE|nr:DUF2798 domain-containing protein [Enterococcus florum]GCF94937.1 DUF2798 domain-containing protein [Enterococcus florum]